MEEKSKQAWLKLMNDYQGQLRIKINAGCKPDKYRQLSALNNALDIVIQRIQNQEENKLNFNSITGVPYHGFKF